MRICCASRPVLATHIEASIFGSFSIFYLVTN